MEAFKRIYNNQDVEMLITAATITENAISQKEFLQSMRSTWVDPYFQDFRKRIDDAIQTHLGVDNARELRLATQKVDGIVSPARMMLALVKVQVEEDFKSDPVRCVEILNNLGYLAFGKSGDRLDQEKVINHLYRFKEQLTEALKAEIVAAGTASKLLDDVAGLADKLKNADIGQEVSKGQRKSITQEALMEFNAIYDQMISIARIASKIYQNDPAHKEMFSYRKVSKRLNSYPKVANAEPVTA